MLIFITLLLATSTMAQNFSEISDVLGLTHTYDSIYKFGGGVSFVDFDQDGWDDLTLSTSAGDSILFYKNMQGSFTLLNSMVPSYDFKKQIQWIDIDNDNDLDLFVTVFDGSNRLFINNGMNNFSSVPLPSFPSIYSAAFGDFDLDGDLDIFLVSDGLLSNTPNQLYLNNGNNQFVDITSDYFFQNVYHPSFTAVFFDPNRDLWPDIYVADDRHDFTNQFYKNLGGGQLSDESVSSNLNVAVEAMGITIGDYNNDLLSDIYITNINGNLLMNNNGDGTFSDTASSANVLCNKVCWSAHLFDYDNDRDLDLHTCATYTVLSGNTNCMYENTGSGSFTDAYNIFLDIDSTSSYSTALGDLNNDGYLDMAVSNTTPDSVQFWMNSGGNNNWLKIMLHGTSSNSMGLGSWIDLYYDNQHFSHYTISGTGFLSQNALYSHFGLDTSSLVDSIIIAWPCGHVDKIYNISANQMIHITEGNSNAIDVSIVTFNNGQICQNDTAKLYTRGKFNTYLWSNGDTTQYIQVGQSGTYHVTVSDWNNNYSTDSITITFVNQNNIIGQINPPSCNGNSDASIAISTNGNINLFQFYWSNGSTMSMIDQLPSGTYTLTITDNNGCSDNFSYTINNPAPIVANAIIDQVDCYGDSTGSIDLNLSGGFPPYYFNWSNGMTSSNIDNLGIGQYNVLITDSMACLLMESYILSGPLTPINTSIIQTDSICFNDSIGYIQSTTSGGIPPYSYLWFNGDTTSSIYNLNPGNYQLTITDVNNCELVVLSTIYPYDSINVNFLVNNDSGNGGSILILSDPLDSLIFLWDNGSTDSFLSELNAGDYSLSITDLNQCVENYTINIPLVLSLVPSEKDELNFYIYPNPCKDLLIFDLKELKNENYLIEIFDLHGRVIDQIETGGSQRISYYTNDLSNGLYNLRLIGKSSIGYRQFIKSE